MAEVVLLDAGPMVALLDRSDAAHAWTVEQLRQLRGTFWTCGAVMAEAMFVLRSQPVAIERLHEQVSKGAIRPVAEDGTLWTRALLLMGQYASVPMSFADASLVALAELHSEPRVFTLDRDFLIYRMHDSDVIPLLAPFNS